MDRQKWQWGWQPQLIDFKLLTSNLQMSANTNRVCMQTLRNLNPDKSSCHGKTCKGNIVGTNNEDDIAGGEENDNDDDDEDDEDDEPQSGSGHSTGCICESFTDSQILYNTIFKKDTDFLVNENLLLLLPISVGCIVLPNAFIFHVIEAAMKSRILMDIFNMYFLTCRCL